MALSQAAFAVFAGIVEDRTGQTLSPSAAWRMETVLRRIMADYGITDFDEFALRLADGDDAGLSRQVVDAVLNNETFFFRDVETFREIERFLAARLASCSKARPLRIWSAGCSTGQEIYSIAMLLHDLRSTGEDPPVRLLGTDISRRAIARARTGLYGQFEIQRGLPVRKMLQWFDQEGERWRAKDALIDMVEFREHNLLDPPPGAPFDMILCRNVLIYFTEANRRTILEQLQRALRLDGALVLGAGEALIGMINHLEPMQGWRGFYGRAHPLRDARFAI